MNEEPPQKQEVINPNSPLFEKQALLEREQMRSELILEVPSAAASENVELTQEPVPEQTEIAPEINLEPKSKPDIKMGVIEGYKNQDKPTKDGVTEIFMETEPPDAMGESKLSKLENQIGVINGTGALAELTGFRETETPEQNPVPDFNRFSREGFKPAESNIPEQILKSVPEITPAPVAVTPEPVQEAPVENFLPEPSTLMNELKGGDIIIKVLKEDLEK